MGRLTDWIFGRDLDKARPQIGQWDIRLKTDVSGVNEFTVRVNIWRWVKTREYGYTDEGWALLKWKDYSAQRGNLDDRKAEAVRWARAFIRDHEEFTQTENVTV